MGRNGLAAGGVVEKRHRSGAQLYLCCKRTHCRYFFYDFGPHIENTYEDIYDGEWIGTKALGENGNTYGVVHRLAGDGSVRGIGTHCLNWAYEQCHHLRIDTHFDNKVMQKLLTGLGFVRCGMIYVTEDHDPRIAYEKL